MPASQRSPETSRARAARWAGGIAALVALALDCAPPVFLRMVAEASGDPFPFLKIFAFWGTIICLIGALIFGKVAVLTKAPQGERIRTAGKIGVATAIAWPALIAGWAWAADAARERARDRENTQAAMLRGAQILADDDLHLTQAASSLAHDWAQALRFGGPVVPPRDPRIVFIGDDLTRPDGKHPKLMFVRRELLNDDQFPRVSAGLLIAYTPMRGSAGYQLIFADGHIGNRPPQELHAARISDHSARTTLGLPDARSYWPPDSEK